MKTKTGTICPLLQKACIEHRCMWFIQLRGTNKNTGQEIDEHGCAIVWLPMLMVENANEARHTAAAVESLRNTTVQGEDATRRTLMNGLGLIAGQQMSLFEEPKQIENGSER